MDRLPVCGDRSEVIRAPSLRRSGWRGETHRHRKGKGRPVRQPAEETMCSEPRARPGVLETDSLSFPTPGWRHSAPMTVPPSTKPSFDPIRPN